MRLKQVILGLVLLVNVVYGEKSNLEYFKTYIHFTKKIFNKPTHSMKYNVGVTINSYEMVGNECQITYDIFPYFKPLWSKAAFYPSLNNNRFDLKQGKGRVNIFPKMQLKIANVDEGLCKILYDGLKKTNSKAIRFLGKLPKQSRANLKNKRFDNNGGTVKFGSVIERVIKKCLANKEIYVFKKSALLENETATILIKDLCYGNSAIDSCQGDDLVLELNNNILGVISTLAEEPKPVNAPPPEVRPSPIPNPPEVRPSPIPDPPKVRPSPIPIPIPVSVYTLKGTNEAIEKLNNKLENNKNFKIKGNKITILSPDFTGFTGTEFSDIQIKEDTSRATMLVTEILDEYKITNPVKAQLIFSFDKKNKVHKKINEQTDKINLPVTSSEIICRINGKDKACIVKDKHITIYNLYKSRSNQNLINCYRKDKKNYTVRKNNEILVKHGVELNLTNFECDDISYKPILYNNSIKMKKLTPFHINEKDKNILKENITINDKPINKLYDLKKDCRVNNDKMSCTIDAKNQEVKLYSKYTTINESLLTLFLEQEKIKDRKDNNVFTIRLYETDMLKSKDRYIVNITDNHVIEITLKPCTKVHIDIDDLERFKYTDNNFYIYHSKDKQTCQSKEDIQNQIRFTFNNEIDSKKICEKHVWIRGFETQCFEGKKSVDKLIFKIPKQKVDTLIIVENNQLFGGGSYNLTRQIKEKIREESQNNTSKLMILESDGSRIRDSIHSMQHLSFQSPDDSFMPFLYLSDLLADVMDSEQGIKHIIYFTAKNGLNKPLITEFAFLQWKDKIKVFTIEKNKETWEKQLGRGESHVETIK